MNWIKGFIVLCLIIVFVSFVFFTISCIFSSWWNIVLVLTICLAYWWCNTRRKKKKTIWQGVILIVLTLLLLAYFLIPCVLGHYKELEEDTNQEAILKEEHVIMDKVPELKKDESQKEEYKPTESKSETDDMKLCLSIKGNITSSGEKIYHVPSGDFYDETVPERTFCTKSEAKAAGFRESKV